MPEEERSGGSGAVEDAQWKLMASTGCAQSPAAAGCCRAARHPELSHNCVRCRRTLRLSALLLSTVLSSELVHVV